MKPANPEKERIIGIVNQLLDRSGLSIDQIVARMQVDGCTITRSTFENRFTTRVHQKPNIPAEWLLAMVGAFVDQLANDERCRAEEAIQLAKLARVPFDLLSKINLFFPNTEFMAAIERQLPSLYGQAVQSSTGGGQSSRRRWNSRSANVFQSASSRSSTANQEAWGEAPDTTNFNGRQLELARLQSWIQAENCRAVGIFGMNGIGKTMLATKLAVTVAESFAAICWRSLHNAPPLLDFIGDCITSLAPSQAHALPPTVEKRQTLLIQLLRVQRSLLVIDNFENVLEDSKSAGSYRLGYENYAHFLRKLAETPHRSCLILTSQEKPIEFALMEGDGLPIRSLALAGMISTDAQQLVNSKGLTGEAADWERFCARYSGNPLALKLAADAIHELFAGDIKVFLATDTTLFHDIRELLDQQFSRLTLLERELLYWLGIERELVTLATLQANLVNRVSSTELLEALRSLRRRSLLEHNQSGFSLSNVVLAYITARLVDLVVAEIAAEMPIMLTSFALLKTQTKEYLRATQIRLLILPILARLRHTGQDDEIITKISNLLRRLQANPTRQANYGAGNLLNLLVYLPANLAQRDFSNLYISQAHLHNVILQDANFTGCTFRDTTFLETFGSISTLAFSPSGDRMAAGMTSGEIQIWQTTNDASPLKLQGHTDMIWSVAFHPDGSRLASSSEDQTVRIWDVRSGECLFNIHAHQGWVKSVCFNRAGTHLASGGHDMLVRIWDLATGRAQRSWTAHAGWVWAVAYSPDDRYLATAGQDQLIKLWDTSTGDCVRILQGHTGPVRALAFAPNGQLLASGSFDHTAKLWDIETGACVHTLAGHANYLWSVAFNPTGALLASSGDDQSVRLWDVATGQVRNLLQGHHNRVWSVAFHPDGQMLASGGDDQTLRFWDVASGQLVRKQAGYTNQVWSIAFAPTQEPAVHTMASGGDDRIVRLWQLTPDGTNHHCTMLLQGHTERVRAVAFSPDGHFVASGSDDHTVRLWYSQRGTCRQLLTGHTNRVWSVIFSADGRTLASASEDQTVRLWDVETGRTRRTIRHVPGRIWSIAFHPWSPLLAGGTDGTEVYLWDAETGEQIQRWVGHQSRIWSVAFSPEGRWLASGSADCTVRLWDVTTGHCRAVLEGHTDAVWSVAFSPDGQWLASSGDDQHICLWHVATGALVHKLSGHQGCVWSLAFTADGLLASGGQDETIRLWQSDTGKWQQTLRSERPYERMNITNTHGLTEAEHSALRALGAIESD